MGEDTKYCGHCKREVSSINFTIHAVHCQRNIAICSMCDEPVPRSHYQQHVETSHKSIPCPKCSLKIEPLKIFTHEKEHCLKRMVTCEHCELEVTAAEHEKHKEYCEARTERCKGCTKYVQVRYLQFHYETDHKYLKPEDKARADENSDDEGSECPICLGPVILPLALDCGHVFCMVCVKGIANTTKNCAICRRDITRDMLMDIRFCREEDIIKNYVNKPREKKTVRSHSVPSRGTGPGGRRLVHHTTEDYDEMVSALMSSRSTTPSYRYQRPSNTNTLPSYTPYSSTTSSTLDSCKDSSKDSCKDSYKDSSESCKESFQEDDCCCSSSRSPSSNSQTTTTNIISNSVSSSSPSPASTTTSTQRASRDSLSRTAVSPTSYSAPPIRSSSASRAITSYSSRTITAPSRTSTSSNATSMSSSKVSTFSTSSATSTTTSSSSASSTNVTSCTSSTASVPSSTTTSSYSSSYSNGARPRRPTTLALETNAVLTTLAAQTSSSNSRLSGSRSAEPPANATQEQYDRWLAFQLAKADDDLPPSEFNRKHKPTFRRSFSMPERPDNVSESSSSSDSDSDTPSSRGSSRRPPASPRNATTSSSASSSTRSTPISKSSSDSNASSSCGTASNGSALSTGARPKSSGLRKRVSFKEDAPPIRREAPVLLPCEFCDEMFPERDLMRHQTSCEQNETQLPRSSRLAQLAAANNNSASTVNLTSTSSNTNVMVTSASSATVTTHSTSTQIDTCPSQPPRRRQGRLTTPVCMPPRKATVPNASPAPERKVVDSSYFPVRKSPAPIPRKTTAQNRNQEPPTTSPPPSCPSSISPPPVSPPPTTTITIVDQPPAVVVSPNLSSGSSRPFSISPASSTSTNNSSVSSGSLSSSSTTPSTSSSASPVPVNIPNPDIAPPDTPTTDIELEYDEDIPFSRPRKGRLLSSAIFSWRSISGSAATRRGSYARSNTAPLEDTNTDSSPQPLQPVTTSKSATQLPSQQNSEIKLPSSYPMISRSPSPSKRQLKEISLPLESEIMKEQQAKDISPLPTNTSTTEPSETVFVKNPNKYRAPPPPKPSTQSTLFPIIIQSVTPSYSKSSSNTIPPSNSQSKNIITHEKTPVNSESITENITQNHVRKGHSQDQNGYIKFDSKPMMNSFVQKEAELRINCEFCKQVFTPERFRCHQTVCEAALRPVSRRASTPVNQSLLQKSKSPIPAKHNKGPAPLPPSPPATADPVPPERPAKDSSTNKRLERSHSVKDERTSYRVSRRLERASSIKESRTANSYINKSSFNRWGSRDCIYSNGIDSPTSYSSPGWSGSTSNIYGGWTGNGSHAWSSHINMVRDDLRHRTAASSVNALSQDNGGDSDNGGENEVDTEGNGRDSRSSRTNSCNSLLVEVRASLNKTSPSHFAVDTGGARYRERSSSRTRPISMYSMSSGSWGSMYDLSSPSRTFNISDAFSTASLASKRRYIR